MKWPMVPLQNILSLEYGSALPADSRNPGVIPVAGSNGISGFHNKALANGPGIVVGRKGSAGKVTWFDTDFWPIDTTYFVNNKQEAEMRFLYYLLTFLNLEKLATSTGVPGLNRNDAYKQLVPFVLPTEQRRIVEILDQADYLRKLRVAADKKAERILPALFNKMFGDPITNPKGWKVTELGKLCDELRYGTSSMCHSEYQDGDLPVLRIPNVIGGKINCRDMKYINLPTSESERILLKPGDILFVRTNGNPDYIGRCAVYDGNGKTIYASYLIRARIKDNKECIPQYVSDCLLFPTYRCRIIAEAKTTAGNFNINTDGLRHLKLPIPPFELQQKYSSLVKQADHSIEQLQSSNISMDRLFNLLMKRAFSGTLTASWREAHMKELLEEMELQAKYLN